MTGSRFQLSKAGDVAADQQQGQEADDAEGAVYQAPEERDAAQGAEDERPGYNADAGNEAEGDSPAVSDRL